MGCGLIANQLISAGRKLELGQVHKRSQLFVSYCVINGKQRREALPEFFELQKSYFEH